MANYHHSAQLALEKHINNKDCLKLVFTSLIRIKVWVNINLVIISDLIDTLICYALGANFVTENEERIKHLKFLYMNFFDSLLICI